MYFKTCKQHLKLLKESNSPSFDAFTCHLAIVCVRYMILAVNQRAASDDRTLGELFWLMTAEAAEISFTKTLALILEALLDTTLRRLSQRSCRFAATFYVGSFSLVIKTLY